MLVGEEVIVKVGRQACGVEKRFDDLKTFEFLDLQSNISGYPGIYMSQWIKSLYFETWAQHTFKRSFVVVCSRVGLDGIKCLGWDKQI